MTRIGAPQAQRSGSASNTLLVQAAALAACIPNLCRVVSSTEVMSRSERLSGPPQQRQAGDAAVVGLS